MRLHYPALAGAPSEEGNWNHRERLGVTVKRVMSDTVAEPAEAMGRAISRTP